jgi:cell division protein ZapA (FtsZ GTPase activity inhibitor)
MIIEVRIGKNKYKLNCRADESDNILEYADRLDSRVKDLEENLEDISENNLLVIAGLMLEQELQQKIDESKEKRDATDREQRALVSNQSADIDNFLNTAQRVINTPKDVIKSATGPVASRLPTLSSDVADFEALVEALGSQAFIAQIPKIKGTGSLSEKEGDKLQASLQTLSLKQSPERLIENVNEAVRLLKKVRENISLKYGVQAPPIDTPAATEATVSLPNGQTLKFPNRAAADAFKKKAGL